ncbi:GH25 family lysozyme [Actinobaculum sp. 352]|uniref:GH25 family lysozyme n=1 Tax=Actinobaculum sp. 352 TaxID=2490946 RepID=UPI000F7E31DD|nr:GH25 family lysozyme [Actinobaculum sp. 352]RTE47667.1 hypothetical protein EKN07_12270 [Actinobaculum sp. 352]
MTSILHGVDVHARYQAGWPQKTIPGVDFVITKATGGTSLVIDGWKSMLAGAKRTGVYHYARERGRAGTAAQEAANFIRQAALAPSDALLVLDWEEASGNNLGNADWVLEWMRLVEAALGRRPVFYTYRATLLAHPSLRRVQQAGYPLWYARYPYSAPVGWKSYEQPTDVPYWGRPAIWQYSSAGGVPGWDAALDLNIFYGGPSDWAALTASTNRDTTSEGESLVARTPAQAVDWAQSMIGKRQYAGMCERFVRTAYGYPAAYRTAMLAYEASKKAGTIHMDTTPPVGVPVFWRLQGVPAGHVALSIGGGRAISTSGEDGSSGIQVIRIANYQPRHSTYLGWAEVYHGQRVYTAAAAAATAATAAATTKTGRHRWYTGRIDGHFGPETVKALQRALAREKRYTRAVDGSFGTETSKSWQGWLRDQKTYTHAVDGSFGVESWKAVQRSMKARNLYSRMIDGQAGTYTITAVQHWLAGNY